MYDSHSKRKIKKRSALFSLILISHISNESFYFVSISFFLILHLENIRIAIYMFSFKSWEGLKHASLSGVADCTNYSLPEGHVFIPGLQTVKEVNMSDDDWVHLNK